MWAYSVLLWYGIVEPEKEYKRKLSLLERDDFRRLNGLVKRAKPPKPVQTFANRLRELREANDWTQDDLAGELECDRAYVSQLERGIQNPSLLTLVKIAKVFSVDLIFAGTTLLG